MGASPSNQAEILEVFRTLLNSTGKFYFWVYDENAQLLSTSSPSLSLEELFSISGCKAYLFEYAKTSSLPLILCSSLGTLWFAAFETEPLLQQPRRIHLVGPVNSVETALSDREDTFKALGLSVEWKIGLERLAKILPIISIISLVPYTQMLHCCVTGQEIVRSDVQFQTKEQLSALHQRADATDPPKNPRRDRHISWMLEQAVLANVRNGNLNYQEDWDRMCAQATGVRVESQDMLARGKMSVVTFIGSCVRAAIEGGMTPEAAHIRGDAYLHSLTQCTTVGDARKINHAMYEDLLHCVHKCRTNPLYSKQIQSCCDYIEVHVGDKVSVPDLAHRVGYSEYYLTRKFKQETGVSIVNYIKFAKVERAKLLLRFSTLPIQEISETLCFCSRSYFTQVFTALTGTSPAQYRAQGPAV